MSSCLHTFCAAIFDRLLQHMQRTGMWCRLYDYMVTLLYLLVRDDRRCPPYVPIITTLLIWWQPVSVRLRAHRFSYAFGAIAWGWPHWLTPIAMGTLVPLLGQTARTVVVRQTNEDTTTQKSQSILRLPSETTTINNKINLYNYT